MIKLVYDKNEMESFKSFYEKIYADLEGESYDYWADYKNLCYSADGLNEFLWDFQDDDLNIVLKNIDFERIKEPKVYDDYEWGLIIKVLKRFVTNYPNNRLEFVNDGKDEENE